MSTQQTQQQQQEQEGSIQDAAAIAATAKQELAQPKRGLFSSLAKRLKSYRAPSEEDEYEKLFEDIPCPTNPPPMPPMPPMPSMPPKPPTLPKDPTKQEQEDKGEIKASENELMRIINAQSAFAYLCINYLELKDIVSLSSVNKDARNIINMCAEIWIPLSKKHLPPFVISKKVPSNSKEFGVAYSNMKK